MTTTTTPRAKAKPRHGTTRRYKDGCRCDPCTAKNTADKQRERDNKAKREGRAPTTKPRIPTTSKSDDEPTHGPIETAARNALKSTASDDVSALRREVVFAAARIMDNPAKPHLFATQANVIRVTVLDLIGSKTSKGGEADALLGYMEKIGSSRGGRGSPPPLDDPAEPVA